MRPERIVFQPPFFNQYLGLPQGIEDLNDPFSDDILLIKVAAPDADQEYVEKEVIQKTITAVEIKPKVSFHEPSEIFDPALELKATRIVDLRPKIE